MSAKIKNIDLVCLIKSILISLCVSFVGVLIFAIVLKFVDMSDAVVKSINQIIKIISIFLGTFFCLQTDKQKGFVKGAVVGVCYTVIAFFVFSLLEGSFIFGKSLVFDILFASIIGCICGIFCANMPAKRKI